MNTCFIERKSSLKEFEVCSKSPNQHRSGLSPKIAIFGFLSCLLYSPHYWDRERGSEESYLRTGEPRSRLLISMES